MNYIEDGELKEQEDNDFENDIWRKIIMKLMSLRIFDFIIFMHFGIWKIYLKFWDMIKMELKTGKINSELKYFLDFLCIGVILK